MDKNTKWFYGLLSVVGIGSLFMSRLNFSQNTIVLTAVMLGIYLHYYLIVQNGPN